MSRPHDDASTAAHDAQTALFRGIFEEHAAYVWNTLRRFGVREADVPDQVQEVFLVLFRCIASGEYDASLPARPYLGAVAFRTASTHRRRASSRHEVLADGSMPVASTTPAADDLLAGAEERDLVLRALGDVSEERRAVFVMHDIDEIPVPEIARALEIPLNTAYSRLRLARQDFAKAVARLEVASRNTALRSGGDS
jgi:RNA polymerase sigma-70 factor, ECF subfamily